MSKPLVYIASPYSVGDQAINTRCQMAAFDDLMNDGIVWPYAPLVSHFQHFLFPRKYQDWVDYDLALIPKFDACLRLSAEYPLLGYDVMESKGAEGEVAKFLELGKPIFYDKEMLYAWVRRGAVGCDSSDPMWGAIVSSSAPGESAGLESTVSACRELSEDAR